LRRYVEDVRKTHFQVHFDTVPIHNRETSNSAASLTNDSFPSMNYPAE